MKDFTKYANLSASKKADRNYRMLNENDVNRLQLAIISYYAKGNGTEFRIDEIVLNDFKFEMRLFKNRKKSIQFKQK